MSTLPLNSSPVWGRSIFASTVESSGEAWGKVAKLNNQNTIAKSVEVSRIEEWKDGRVERKEGFVLRFTTPFQEDKDRTDVPM
jgi:hypothetical protein